MSENVPKNVPKDDRYLQGRNGSLCVLLWISRGVGEDEMSQKKLRQVCPDSWLERRGGKGVKALALLDYKRASR
jgi:hypothetical protein